MDVRVSTRQSNGKYKTYYINIPKHVLKTAKWLKRQKVVDMSIDLIGNVVIKPE